MNATNNAAQPAEQEAVRRALELYAECYDTMTRIARREGREPVVSPVSVAFDIRKNMVDSVVEVLSKLRAEGVPVADGGLTHRCANCSAVFQGVGCPSCRLAAPVASAPALDLATAIHWPACWDTAAYPTLESAMSALVTSFQCSNQEAHHAPAINLECLTDPSALAALADGLESIACNENAALVAAYIRQQAEREASAPADDRAAFEAAWCQVNSPIPLNTRRHDDGRYATPDIEREWRLWQARAALASAPVDPEAEEVDFLVRVLQTLETWRAEEWNELIERRPAILALLRPLVLASAPVAGQVVAWAAIPSRGMRAGRIYSTCDTRKEIDAYIELVHQSNDSLTLTPRPLSFADAAPQASEAVRILFPAHLRKMWSGGEVQAWLDEHQGVTPPPAAARGSLQRYRQWKADQAAPVCSCPSGDGSLRPCAAHPAPPHDAKSTKDGDANG